MPAKPRAVYISPSYARLLPAFPAEVHEVRPQPGIFDLPAYLEERGLPCDLVIQDETLSPRVLVKGLWEIACPKVYWSLDPHLNHYWQGAYCAQFDVTACTQKAWLEPLERAGTGRAEWLTWCEEPGPWQGHAGRTHRTAFVGRITEHRAKRRLFADFLAKRHQAHVETDLAYDEVSRVYGQTRLAPNESLQGEITQRLFVAAAQGCLVLDPASDNGLAELFEPGREVTVYHDPFELDELLVHYRRHPAEAERLGRAAWERVIREHGPGQRMEALGRMALGAPAGAPRGREGERLFWLGAARCLESRLVPAPPEAVLKGLAQRQDDPRSVTAMLRLLSLGGQAQQALGLAWGLLGQGAWPEDADFNLAGAGLGLNLGQIELARVFLDRLGRASGLVQGEIPLEPGRIYAAMGDAYLRLGTVWRPGFLFDPEACLPATATECLGLALDLLPGDMGLMRKYEALLRSLPGAELPRLGLLSELSLRDRDNFRVSLALGLADIGMFRVKEGLGELALARDLAQAQGRGQALARLLGAADPGGRIREALGAGRYDRY
jgi:hypothetical protein